MYVVFMISKYLAIHVERSSILSIQVSWHPEKIQSHHLLLSQDDSFFSTRFIWKHSSPRADFGTTIFVQPIPGTYHMFRCFVIGRSVRRRLCWGRKTHPSCGLQQPRSQKEVPPRRSEQPGPRNGWVWSSWASPGFEVVWMNPSTPREWGSLYEFPQ